MNQKSLFCYSGLKFTFTLDITNLIIFLENHQFEIKSFVKIENNIQRREEQSPLPKPACSEN